MKRKKIRKREMEALMAMRRVIWRVAMLVEGRRE
jgi:hypothetical protein